MKEDKVGSLPAPPGSTKSKQSSRRQVAFSESSAAPSTTRDDGAFFSPPDLDGERPKCLRTSAHACCAWGCMCIFAFILLALIISFVLVTIFHFYLPVIRVRRFNATKIQFSSPNNQQKVNMKGNLNLLMEINNQNEKTELKFGSMKVSASSSNVNLGRIEFQAFTQPRNTSKSLNTTIGVNNSGVDKDDAEILKQDIKNQEFELNLNLVGSISFAISGINLNQIPIIASCDCKQTEVDFGKNAKCNYRIFKP